VRPLLLDACVALLMLCLCCCCCRYRALAKARKIWGAATGTAIIQPRESVDDGPRETPKSISTLSPAASQPAVPQPVATVAVTVEPQNPTPMSRRGPTDRAIMAAVQAVSAAATAAGSAVVQAPVVRTPHAPPQHPLLPVVPPKQQRDSRSLGVVAAVHVPPAEAPSVDENA